MKCDVCENTLLEHDGCLSSRNSFAGLDIRVIRAIRGENCGFGVRGQKSEKTKVAPVATWQLRFAGLLVGQCRRFDSTYCLPRRCGWNRHSHKVTRLTNSVDFPRCFSRPGFRCKSLLIHRLRPKTRQIGRMNGGELAFLAFSRPFRHLRPADWC